MRDSSSYFCDVSQFTERYVFYPQNAGASSPRFCYASLADSTLGLNRPGSSRHLQAVHYGNHGGVYERQAVFG